MEAPSVRVRMLHAVFNASECRNSILGGSGFTRLRIWIDNGRELYGKSGAFQLPVHAQMVAAEGACTDYGNPDGFIAGSFSPAGHLLHRALYSLAASAIQLEQLRHLVFGLRRAGYAETNRRCCSLRAEVRGRCDELQQIERDILGATGADVTFHSQCILHFKINSDAIGPALRTQIGYKHLVSDRQKSRSVIVLGSYVADLAFRTPRLPAWGETCMGSAFQLGPGGKGSNQAVAAARAGARVSFISKLANDSFGEMARSMWKHEGIDASHVSSTTTPTGAAAIILDQSSGENAIVVVPGACYELSSSDVQDARSAVERGAVFLTQLELPLATVRYGIELAHSVGVTTILNPAPACALPDSMYPLCDFITPNESEVELLTGIAVRSVPDAERAADTLLARGARNAIITLGARGALVKDASISQLIPAFEAGAVVDTTGAGDAFNGGLAVALSEGLDVLSATRFACAVASLSVTKPGTAPSMPYRAEIEALLAR